MSKLSLNTPSTELVDAYLYEIAKGYGITWSPPKKAPESKSDDAGDLSEGTSMKKVRNTHSLDTWLLIASNRTMIARILTPYCLP